MKTIRLKESDIQRMVKRVLNEQELPFELDQEKVSSILNKIFPSLRHDSVFMRSHNIPFDYHYYSKGVGKTEEEIVEEFINLTPLQLYERTKLYEKEFRETKYNL